MWQPPNRCRRQTRLKDTRARLLRSTWFVDANGTTDPTGCETARLVFQPDGAILLPHLSAKSAEKTIDQVIKGLSRQLGQEGVKAVREYLSRCELRENTKVTRMLDKHFPITEVASDKKDRPAASQPAENHKDGRRKAKQAKDKC